ncbi:carboxypeptidase, partial [Lactobacillus sp. XV13L]|nr:carboxypeptidase [Lactobacillus sp. XV13L]
MSNFQKKYPKIAEIADFLLHNPELGYKECKTSERIEDEIHQISPRLKVEHYLKTGLRVTLPNNKQKTIGIIAEMDSLYQPNHKLADANTGAAQACGHYTQVTTALAIMNEVVANHRLEDFGANLAFIFTPSEEFVDLAWRKQQKETGQI